MLRIFKNLITHKPYLCIGIFLCVFLANTNAQAATSSIMLDADTGKVISQYNADQLRYPASLTKIMTLYLTFEAIKKGRLRMSDRLLVSRRAANMEPSRLGLRAGQRITVKNAINALIVKSANDCAVVLAEAIAGTEAKFAIQMTNKARALGMRHTTFKNASGLPNTQQRTTARDMAKLATAMYKHFPQYYILFSQKTFSYNGRTMYTHNHVLKKFKGADGMKTGYTRAAGFNIVTSAKRQGNRVIAVTMGHKTLNARDNQVISMMSRGLTKLAQNDRDRTARMYAKLKPIVPIPAVKPKHLAQNQETAQTWGIQLGAFSNYTKARNYALKIKNSTQPYLKGKDISIEPIATGAAVVYRTKIVGLARNDADTACKKIKSKNKTCIVVAANPTKHYASARRY